MAFGRKKKKETAEELKAKLAEIEGEPEEDLDVLPEAPKPPKEEKEVEEVKTKAWLKKNKEAAELEPKGEFSLSSDEMTLAVNALASSEEFKVYQQMVIGQQIANIIAAYNKAVGGKSEVPSEDTEEELPEPQ